jgi:hypothetical protein
MKTDIAHAPKRPISDGQDIQNRKAGRAWLVLCCALAIHVADEAATGFLSVYNASVLALRENLPWIPLPVFRFEMWLGGLILGIVLLLYLTRFLFRGSRWMRAAAYALTLIMLTNGLLHTLGTLLGRTVSTVHFPRPMPGFYSTPLLLAASVYLLMQLRHSAPGARIHTQLP